MKKTLIAAVLAVAAMIPQAHAQNSVDRECAAAPTELVARIVCASLALKILSQQRTDLTLQLGRYLDLGEAKQVRAKLQQHTTDTLAMCGVTAATPVPAAEPVINCLRQRSAELNAQIIDWLESAARKRPGGYVAPSASAQDQPCMPGGSCCIGYGPNDPNYRCGTLEEFERNAKVVCLQADAVENKNLPESIAAAGRCTAANIVAQRIKNNQIMNANDHQRALDAQQQLREMGAQPVR
jgi:hypothetical protein